MEIVREVTVHEGFEVIVSGGGVAGTAAAVAAARAGKRVLLIEKNCVLGGLATSGLINLFVPMCNGRGRKIIFGMVDEFVSRAIRHGYDRTPPEWRDGKSPASTTSRYAVWFSPQIFALELAALLEECGVRVMFDTRITEVVMSGGHCRGVVVENVSGAGFYPAQVVIDATGDATVLHRAGVPTVEGRNFFTYCAHGISLASCEAAVAAGDIARAVAWRSGGDADLYGRRHPEGLKFYGGVDGDEVSEYLLKNQLTLLEKLAGEDRRSREIVTLPGMAQLRTIRRIAGDYTLTVEDSYRHFDDSVAAICDFDRRDYLFEIPWRTMRHSGFDNLIAAGRVTSAEGYAWDVVRVIPPAILTGQAAGTAAALALDSGRNVDELAVNELQSRLRSGGMLIHFDDAWIPEAGAAADGDGSVPGHM